MFDYTYEMNLEYFANENDLDLAENNYGDLYIFVDKDSKSKEELQSIIDNSEFDFRIEEFETFYQVK